MESYQQAVRLEPDSVMAHDAIADLYFEQQDVLMTIVAHLELLELAPDHASGYYHLAIALEARGRTAEAVEALQRAKTLLLEQENEEDVQVIDELLQELETSWLS
jgi:tetratricopeptide (TPR) repeat protein